MVPIRPTLIGWTGHDKPASSPIADIGSKWDDCAWVTNFEFFFSLFGLLFGFVLVEVLSGLVRTLKAKRLAPGAHERSIRLGWLTPLLGLFVLFDISSCWGNLWDMREAIPVGFDTIFGALFITGVYYFAASLVFPDEAQAWPNLDDWFWLHRRHVLGGVLAVNLIWIPLWKALTPGGVTNLEAFLQLFYFGPLLIAMLAKRAWLVGLALAFISTVYASLGVADLVSHVTGG